MTIQQQIINNLPQAKILFFPNDHINGKNTGSHYLPIENIQVQYGDYNLWATAICPAQPPECQEIIITCDTDQKIHSMVDYFLQTQQKKTIIAYVGLADVDTEHSDLMRLIQYGEYRSLKDKVQKNAIYYPMVFGNDRVIPF